MSAATVISEADGPANRSMTLRVAALPIVLTDRGAPNKKIVSAPIDRPTFDNWKTVVAESKSSIEQAGLIAGKLFVNALVDVASEVRFYNLDGATGTEMKTPGLGTVSGP